MSRDLKLAVRYEQEQEEGSDGGESADDGRVTASIAGEGREKFGDGESCSVISGLVGLASKAMGPRKR